MHKINESVAKEMFGPMKDGHVTLKKNCPACNNPVFSYHVDHYCEFPEESYTELKEIFGNVQNPSCQYKYSLRKMLNGGLV